MIKDRYMFPRIWRLMREMLGGAALCLTHGLLLFKMISFLPITWVDSASGCYVLHDALSSMDPAIVGE